MFLKASLIFLSFGGKFAKMNSLLSWIKKNRLEILILLFILATAAFFRLYRISEYMTFLGDEGRDALMVKRILIDRDFPLLGPPTSIGNIYLGPLYYYMMAVPMAIFWLNPVAAAGMVAALGIAAVALIYYLTREWFGKAAASASALLYAISPITIIYSRSSWNPNPAPFFALLAILGIYKARQRNDFRWFILTGVALAFVVQMHYTALLLIPFFALLWLYELFLIRAKGAKRKYFWSSSLAALLAFLFLMSPLLIFDLKYNFVNYRAFIAFFSQGGNVGFQYIDILSRSFSIYKDNLVGRYMGGSSLLPTYLLSFLIILPLIISMINKVAKRKPFNWVYLALGAWLVIGILGLSFLRQSIYDHYLGFLNPVPFMLLGSSLSFVKKFKIPLTVLLIFGVGLVNLSQNPLFYPPNNQLRRTQEIAKFIINEAREKPFNFALIAARNYDAAYQFYLEVYNHKPKIAPLEITKQLFVVCEDMVCQPTYSSKYEIASFGWTKIVSEQDFAGVKVFKLVPYFD
ncbi:MAG: ArnT family glycosyltransferase [Alphaproteobacteria bacterium]